MADRSLLRLSATLVVIGELLFALVTLFHADGEANNHPAVFAEYASSASWIAVHFVQFVFMAVLLLGLLVLFFALNVRSGILGWVGRFSAVSVVVALALYGVVQAVDGVEGFFVTLGAQLRSVPSLFSGALAVTNAAATSRTSAGLGGTTALLAFRL